MPKGQPRASESQVSAVFDDVAPLPVLSRVAMARVLASLAVTLVFACQDPPDAKRTPGHAPVAREGTRGCDPSPVELSPATVPRPVFDPAIEPATDGKHIIARWYDARIFAHPSFSATVIGYARRGSRVQVRGAARGEDCPADLWYELASGGYACAAKGFRVDGTAIPDPVEPALDKALPYSYAKVTGTRAPRLRQLPSAEEWAAVQAARTSDTTWPEIVQGTMDGAFFVTVVETVEHAGESWHRTDAGDFVWAGDVQSLTPPSAIGRRLEDGLDLPIAFARTETPVHCKCGDALVECGVAHTHASVALADATPRKQGGRTVVASHEDRFLDREQVRLATDTERPAEVPADARWVHVDLPEQTLVAYEGDRPVYATVVASGKGPDHATPPGVYRVERKYVTTTMSGPDEDKGSYTVSEVPWTMYYDGDFALHGAYWHDAFGAERSHGCINLPPTDARWLFGWSGALPAGWHASSRVDGPWVVITG